MCPEPEPTPERPLEPPAADLPDGAPAEVEDPRLVILGDGGETASEEDLSPESDGWSGDSADRLPPERFLRVEFDALEHGLCELWEPEQRSAFRRLAKLLLAHFGVELLSDLGDLRRSYRVFDPSRETVRVLDEDDSSEAREACLDKLSEMLDRANYVELERRHLEEVLGQVSPQGVRVQVDLSELASLRVWARGRGRRNDRVRKWLKKEEVETDVFRRLFLAVAVAEEPNRLHLRLFKDVAKNDLEMFLPNTEIRMKLIDKIKLGITGGGGTIGGAVATATKVTATTSALGWGVALVGFGGVVWRQVRNVFHHRTRYMAALAQYLYFHGLDNDRGAAAHVAQQAVEEEAKEALLAYALVASRPTLGWTLDRLDRAAEAHLRDTLDLDADFDVHGGVDKLLELGLFLKAPDGQLVAQDPVEAFRALDERWDRRFDADESATPHA